MTDTLSLYRAKRNFAKTPEPSEGGTSTAGQLQFVIQKHWATRLHYDLRLEIDGTMKSWAVPKGPSLDPADKRMAVEVEDHPMSYNNFEGQIPAKQYGAGRVIIWDKGTWEPVGDAREGWRKGRLKFELHGHKLHGHWALVRMAAKTGQKPAWLLIKERDGHARAAADYSVVEAEPDSVVAQAEHPESGLASKVRAVKTPGKRPAASFTHTPHSLAPQLATLAAAPPADSSDWLYELKFDGYRILSRIDEGKVQLFTRNGHDWTNKLRPLEKSLKTLDLRSGWLDGEVVALDSQGLPNFQQLQNAFDDGSGADALVYYVFDLPFAEGEDLRLQPLAQRRERLKSLFTDKTPTRIRYSESFAARPENLMASACKIGFEGVIGKSRDAPYTSGRSTTWIKLKCGHEQEFVIGGYTAPKGSRVGLGSLLLGVYDSGQKLHYVGNVGTGFTDKSLVALVKQLTPITRKTSPFAPDNDVPADARWVQPKLVAQVAFAQWTQGRRIRHSVFKGLRTDKPPHEIQREEKMPTDKQSVADKAAKTKSLPSSAPRISHGDRIIDPSTGITKLALAAYYAKVAPLMLEHLRHRPVALVRAPAGVEGELFFQKHQEALDLEGIAALNPALDPGHAPLLEIVSQQGLLNGAQMNVIEYHTWNARRDKIERPDRMTFDLDPGEGVPWEQVQEGADLLRVLLQELGLPAFLKTSGGKGLHIVVPIKRLRDWATVKDFSQAIVQHLAQTVPQRFVAKSGPRNRVGKIFVDYLRNGRGATTICAWSARARPGMGVSVPVAWNELEKLTSAAHWNVQNIEQRLRVGNGPWETYASAAVSLASAIKALPAPSRA